MTKHIKSSLECIQTKWGYILRDFRQWCKAEGQAMISWKQAPIKQAIMACRSSMIDDAENMLNAWVENNNTNVAGGKPHKGNLSAFIPVMTTAIAPINTPPEFEQVVGRSEWLDVVIPSDPLQRVVQMRTMPSAFRCQIAFFCPDTHGATMVANQFCLYFKNEAKRTFNVPFELGFADQKKSEKLVDDWEFRVLENSLFPDTAVLDYKNLTVATVECTLIGNIPIVTGLGGMWDDTTDVVEQGTPPKYTPIKGSRLSAEQLNSVVVEADVYDTSIPEKYTHVEADKNTGDISVEQKDI